MRHKPLKSKQQIKDIENQHPINKADNDWLDKIYRKSKADRSRTVAQTSLKAFDIFCKSQGMEKHPDLGVKYAYIPKMLEQYKIWYNPKPNMRCSKCDLLLLHSRWKDECVYYSTNRNPLEGFLCIQCATIKTKCQKKPRVTPGEIDIFIKQNAKMPQVLV